MITLKAILLMLMVPVLGLVARAQSEARRIEVSAQFAALRIHSAALPAGFQNDIDDNVFGGGARIGHNFSKHLAAECEVNVFQRPPTSDPATRGKWTRGFFGIKATKHLDRVGLFLKMRPGFKRFDGITSLVTGADGRQQIGLLRDNTYDVLVGFGFRF